jgi:hypothetical protein
MCSPASLDVITQCYAIAKGEAWRLINRGVRASLEDVVQDGMLALLEEGRRIEDWPPQLARIVIRRRLLNSYVRDPLAKKRGATMVHIESVAGEDGDRLEDMSVPGHEADVLERVTLEAIGRAVQPPSLAGGTRQARAQAMQRFVTRAQKFVRGDACSKESCS